MPGISGSALREALASLAGGTRRLFHDTGMPGVPVGNAVFGGVAGGIMGEGGSPYDHDDGGNGFEGALGGAALGAGLGLVGGGRQMGRNLRSMLAENIASRGTRRLASVKREALDYVRNNPVAVQRVMAAKDENEISQIVNDVISRTRVRSTEGGF